MWTEGRVIERIDWNSKLFSLRIAAEIAPFIAGQFIKLSQVRDDKTYRPGLFSGECPRD